MPVRVKMPKVCPCPSCTREGAHHAWCTVHLADYENMRVPPCDCGRRDGKPRIPELAPTASICAVSADEVLKVFSVIRKSPPKKRATARSEVPAKIRRR